MSKKKYPFEDIKERPAEIIPTDDIKNKIPQINKVRLSMEPINDLKDAVIFVCRLINGAVLSLKDDGKITIADLPKFGGMLTIIIPFLTGIGNIPKQASDIDNLEMADIIATVKDELELEDNIEEIVERILAILWQLSQLIKDIIVLVKK